MIKRIINITLNIILFLLPLTILPPGFFPDNAYIAKMVLLYICGSILLICLIIKHKELKFDKTDKILLMFILLVIISTIFSVNVKKSILGEKNRYEGLLTFICYFLTYYCGKYYFEFNNEIILNSIIVMFFTSILAILQFYEFPIIRDIFEPSHHAPNFASSTFGNRNFFGSFLSITLPYMMCLYIFYHKKIYLFSSAIAFYGLLVSLTRSAWIAFVVFSIIGFIYILKLKNKKFLKRAIIILCIFTILFLIACFSAPELFLGRYSSILKDFKNISDSELSKKAGSNRIIIWQSAIRIIKSNPIIGCGPDAYLSELSRNHISYTFNELIPTIGTVPDKAHNEFLHIGATIGIPALIVHFTFLFMTFKNLTKNNFYKTRKAFILFLCLIGYLVQAFFNISTIGVAPIFYFLLGYCYNFDTKKQFKN